jgi:hypothetical protein|tara:strand:- start:1179 stop:1574 length:396 start_codon:yes stop_codon:yes gene_type:complete
MATLGTKLQLTIAAGGLTRDALNVSLSKNLTVTGKLGGVIKVTATSAGSSANIIYTADDFAAPAYLFLYNTDTTATDYIFIYDDTTSGDPVIAKLAGGDFAFLPLNADKTLRAYATTNPTTLEYALFGTDQ